MGTKLLEPIGVLQPTQVKQWSWNTCPLYSTFFDPELRVKRKLEGSTFALVDFQIVLTLTRPENIATSFTFGRKLDVVAVAAVQFVRFRAEIFVHQGNRTLSAQKARFVPVFVLVCQVLFVKRKIFSCQLKSFR